MYYPLILIFYIITIIVTLIWFGDIAKHANIIEKHEYNNNKFQTTIQEDLIQAG